MSYDEASFKAGFALGRALWKPPRMKTDIDTGFGWTADAPYLMYAADTWIGTNGGRSYYKGRNGWAIVVWCDPVTNTTGHSPGTWYGAYVISTDSDAAAIKDYNGGVHTGSPNPLAPVEYLGRTWYFSVGSQLPARYADDSTAVPIFTGTYATKQDIVLAILQTAHVRLTGGGS